MVKEKFRVEEQIIRALGRGPRNKIELRNSVVDVCKVTPQAFYKEFDKLKKNETVTISRNLASLSIPWIHRMLENAERVIHSYHLSAYRSYFGNLKNGEKKTYR